ncbi:MAG: type II toxin-antitoxin system YafQ family toxin [bacterium]|nr:type II toxin-antitoxin system YafQ family toxin [bacterium]
MRRPSFTRRFQRDLKRMGKRGKDVGSFKEVARILVEDEPLPQRCRDHKLLGRFADRRECHIEPDWLLIYKLLDEEVIFERTGTHSDLFG